MLKALRNTQSDNRIQFKGDNFLVVSFVHELTEQLLNQHEAVIINTSSQDTIFQILEHIQSSKQKRVYLKPIFIAESSNLNKQVYELCDGKTDLVNLQYLHEVSARINEKIELVVENKLLDYKSQLVSKLIAYLFTRNKPLKPVSTRRSKTGYYYPFVNNILSLGHTTSALDVLYTTQRQELASTSLIDRVHLCPSCKGNYINFREACPKCHSVDIHARDLVHHFKCAHVAPIEDFQKAGEMVCPKCENKLRHIGIDYDKPSSMYNCHSCTHEFQEAEMHTHCFDCGHEGDIHQLEEKTINVYSLTDKGEEYVKTGPSESRKTDDEGEAGVVGYRLFKILLNQEIERVKLKGINSYLVKISLDSTQLPYLNESSTDMFKAEIIGIIKEYLERTDILSAGSFTNYSVILTDTEQQRAAKMKQLIENNLSLLINDNVEGEANIKVDLIEVTNDKNLEDYL